jgi:DNA polymerase-1
MKKYKEHNYVETLTGRRRHAPMSANMVYNSCIQGSASDIVVNAMNRLSDISIKTNQPGLQAVLNVHDDLTFCVPKDGLEDYLEIIAREMTTPHYDWINLPLEIEMSVGPNWYSLEHVGKFKTGDFTG